MFPELESLKKYAKVTLISLITLGSCMQPQDPLAGISLSFDDRSIKEWFELRDLFNTNNVKATFFISQPDSLDSADIHQLRILEKDGHEIGFHGNHHVLSEYYIKDKSYKQYLQQEIEYGLNKMDSLGFKCSSFAYPYGAKYWFTDFLLSYRFKKIRGVSALDKKKTPGAIDNIFVTSKHKNYLSALSIDKKDGLSRKIIDQLIHRAYSEKEVVVLYGHVPGKSFDMELLEYIIEQGKKKNLTFYTIDSF